MNFPRIMRAGIAILLLILLAIIVRYFMIRSLGESQADMKTDELTQQKREKAETFSSTAMKLSMTRTGIILIYLVREKLNLKIWWLNQFPCTMITRGNFSGLKVE